MPAHSRKRPTTHSSASASASASAPVSRTSNQAEDVAHGWPMFKPAALLLDAPMRRRFPSITPLLLCLQALVFFAGSYHVLLWRPSKNSNVRLHEAVVRNVHSLRFLAFGTSRTKGNGLLNPEKEAFITLLSPQALNLAISGGDVDCPSLCLYSLIGDHVFDVIVIESKAMNVLFPFLKRLLVRLRHRFPDAPIIFVSVRTPADYWHKVSSVNARMWMTQEGFKSKNDPHFLEHILETSPSDWSVDDYSPAEQRRVAMSVDNVHILQFPAEWYPNDPRQFLLHNYNLFGDHKYPEHEWSHFSELGHETIAQGIHEILANLTTASIPSSKVGIWVGGTDQCDSWLSTGQLGQVQSDMPLIEFDTWNHKWALDVPSDGGFITINSSVAADVYIDHMKLYPERDQYPNTVAVLGNQSTVLDPRFEFDLPGPAHITNTAFIGQVEPGVVNVTFLPLEKGMANPFRITGVLRSPRDDDIYNILE